MSEIVFDALNDTFNCISLAAVVNEEVFCCHGGIGPHLNRLKDIEKIECPVIPCGDNLVNDLLWADPSPYEKTTGFKINWYRRTSWVWGKD